MASINRLRNLMRSVEASLTVVSSSGQTVSSSVDAVSSSLTAVSSSFTTVSSSFTTVSSSFTTVSSSVSSSIDSYIYVDANYVIGASGGSFIVSQSQVEPTNSPNFGMTMSLPPNPRDGLSVTIKDGSNAAGINNILVTGSLTIQSPSIDYTAGLKLNQWGASATLIFSEPLNRWNVTSYVGVISGNFW